MTARPIPDRDSSLKSWLRALELTAPIERQRSVTLPVVIDSLADRFGAAPALVSKDASLSYVELAATANRYARWALAHGIVAGETICLLMPNCPDYMAIWLGLTRVGAIVSLLNTNLTGERLAHCINIVTPRCVIVAAVLAHAAKQARPHVPTTVQWFAHGRGEHELPRIDLAVTHLAADRLADSEYERPSLEDRALYIYTSGTTGLPKAANVSHFRLMQWSHWFAGMMNSNPGDRMFNCLPMYHSVGGVVATGATLVGGGTVIVRERFSASDFWRDVTDERCTLFQYIGELCRYLLNSPPQPQEAQHGLRLACGNGLQQEVWVGFRDRFRIPRILEYYASTEGNFSLYNCDGRPGAIGRIPPFLAHRMPIALVKFDLGSGAPLRDQAGRCVRCARGETGEAIGEVVDASGRHGSRFEGYADASASQSKLLRDVFADGDAWYRTGDLMRQDPQGFFYFVDRVGDTYRWKGENVSTTEVTTAITACRGVTDAAVYGVTVPQTEGRAGMAALVVTAEFDLATFRLHMAAALPDYGRPLFLRIVPAIELTGTFKLNKQELAQQGYDLAQVSDPMHVDDRLSQAYVRLDAVSYERIRAGNLRL